MAPDGGNPTEERAARHHFAPDDGSQNRLVGGSSPVRVGDGDHRHAPHRADERHPPAARCADLGTRGGAEVNSAVSRKPGLARRREAA